MPHVVVIGAGTAGLTAARQLSKVPGFKLTVLEATSRIGGRIKSVEVDGERVDLGASWMHETRVNPIFTEALKANWKLKYTDAVTKFYTNKGEIPTKSGVAQIIGEIESMVAEYFHQEKPLLPSEPSLRDFVIERAMQNISPLATDEQKYWAELMYRQVEHYIGLKWSDIPAGEGGMPSPLGRDAFVLSPGYQQVIDRLMSETNSEHVEIRLDEPVMEVRRNDGSSLSVSTTRNTYTADYVVCTIPLGALKKSAATLFGGLGPEIDPVLDTVQRTSMASLGKVIVEFPSTHWDTDADSFCVANEETGDLVSIINPYGGVDPKPLLVALVGPDLTQKVESAPASAYETIEWAFRAICSKGSIEKPKNVIVTDWTQSDFFRGSYSARSIGQSYDDLVDAYIEGIGRLRFAGEHTTLEGNGCVHGAYLSGMREAEYIIDHYKTSQN